MFKMTLSELAQHLGQDDVLEKFPCRPFSGLSQDSRLVKSGDIFVVIPSDQAEVNARQALLAGAVALVAEPSFVESMRDSLDGVIVFTVGSTRRSLSQIAALLYPGQPETMVAVTGTNGKSSVVTAVRQIWQALGYAAASMGTLGVDLSYQVKLNKDLPSFKLTTPDALTFHQTLNALSTSGVTHCAFEASSHGLDQYRLHGAKLKAAGFTNLTQDHLDYHKTMAIYFEAKARLFTEVLPEKHVAVMNVASSFFPSLKAFVLGRGQQVLSYGVEQEADLVAHNIHLESDQMRFDLTFQKETWSNISVNMVGSFQIENILCAMGLVYAGGVSIDSIVKTLPSLCSAPGRMELVGKTRQGGSIFIDYAHTPDALNRSLAALRMHLTGKGRLKVVFGCGGNRDADKRVQMGQVAQELADDVYVTDDNPRYEDPAFIRAQILGGCPKAQEIGDRNEAIRTAIHHMETEDILLIAGKGHERGQIIKDRIIPFDDRIVAQAVLKESM